MSDGIKVQSNKIRMVDIHKVQQNPKNPNVHPEDQIERLAKLIDYQGFRNPLVVSARTGFLVVGHGRLMAAKKLGMEKVPVMVQEFEDEAQEYAYLVSDNAISEWATLDLGQINQDFLDLGPELDLEMLGIKDFVIEPIEKLDPLTDEDSVPEVKHDPVTKRGDVWLLGNHRVMCGDSTMIDDVERLTLKNTADLLFTSPPYSDMRDYNGNKDLSEENLSLFFDSFKSKYYVVNLGLKRNNNCIVPYWQAYLDRASDLGLNLLSWNIWDKGEAGSFANQQAMFPIEHEWIFVFGEKRGDLTKTEKTKHAGTNITMTVREKDGSLTPRKGGKVSRHKHHGTIFRQTTIKGSRKYDHPAAFPVELVEKHLRIFNSELVFEPFCGSGTTLIACEKTDRKCYGMELDEHYCDVIINRWQDYTGKEAILESTGESYNTLLKNRG